MKYFNELNEQQQAIVLDRTQDLPLFEVFRNDVANLLLTSKNYMFDENLKMHII